MIDGEYIWKYTHKAYDFSVLGNTPITYPIEWASSKIPGYAIRASVPNFHGLTAFVVMSSVAARFFGPQVSGIGATPTSFGARRRVPHRPRREFQRDHSPAISAIGKRGPWIGFNWRYDSGLVAGPVPCAGGNCNNGPNGTDTIVDVSGLTPDQQFEAGLFCGSVHATPTTPISPDRPVPGVAVRLERWSRFPRPGTEDDDHNPPRIASRNLFDLAVGHDNIFHGDKLQVERPPVGGQPDQQGSAVQLPFDVQRNALRDAAHRYGDDRVPLLRVLSMVTPAYRPATNHNDSPRLGR